MPRRHISQREAHAMRRRLYRLERYANDTAYPLAGDPDALGLLMELGLTDRARGTIEGARTVRLGLALVARLADDGKLHVYAYLPPKMED